MIVLIMLFSILGSATFSPGQWHQQFKVGLGLDLSSGTQVVLKAETDNGKPPQPGEMQQAINVLLSRVNGTGNSGAQVEQAGSSQITISIPGKPASDVVDLVSTTAKMAFRPVILEEGYTPPSTATPSGTPSATPSASGSAAPTPSGSASSTPKPSAGTTPSPSGSSSASTSAYIVHHAPAAAPSASATGSASAPAGSATPAGSAAATPAGSATPAASATAPAPSASAAGPSGDPSQVSAANMALFNKMVCKPSTDANTVDNTWKSTVGYAATGEQYDNNNAQVVSCDGNGTKYVLGPAVFAGTQITGVQTGLLQNSGSNYVVNLTLNSQAASAFGKLTTTQYNDHYTAYSANPTTDVNDYVLAQTAVVLDGNVNSAPVTQGAITTGQVQINGGGTTGFTQDEANQLANVLKYGQLPLNFIQQSVSSISPELGRDSLNAGLLAGVIGLLLVIIYLFYYYRGLGIVAVSSLLIAALIAYLAVVLLSRYQSYTMELAGIAGLIVSIGITADSFIVFFERLRDEVREGKALRPAVESGWKRARRTILVSDTVSFVAAVLLYHFAVSDVQGFAYTLGLTTIIDVLVVFTFTKPLVTLLANTKFYGGGHKWSGLDPARLGSKSPWRGQRRTVRSQRPVGGSRPSSGTSATGSSAGASTPSEA